MPMVNPFSAFSVNQISAAIDKIPNNYGRIGELNLMPLSGISSRTVTVEERNGSLALIPANADGGPGNVGTGGKRKVRTFQVPQLIYDEHVSPADVLGLRSFGGNQMANLAGLLNEKLATARAKHDITLEHLRMGAVKGVILDADGSTLVDLYTEFGVAQNAVDFDLGTSTTDVKAKCLAVSRLIEDNLMGERMTGTRVMVSQEFFDKLTSHPNVKDAYARWQNGAALRDDMRKGFPFGNLVFEEYRGQATDPAGNPRRFIAANEGHAFPEGTISTFKTFAAPADFNETVGKIGQLYYAKTVPGKYDRGWDIHTQSNPLPMCMRPGVLVRCHTTT